MRQPSLKPMKQEPRWLYELHKRDAGDGIAIVQSTTGAIVANFIGDVVDVLAPAVAAHEALERAGRAKLQATLDEIAALRGFYGGGEC
jgi:hypothetical protein